jgi:transcriptional regulator with PAS, ATPase and Fis domain
MTTGAFRNDLFYRLNEFPIEMPPLRERREDIPLLVEYFVERCARKVGKKMRGIDKRSIELLQSYHWPGNIRELQNVIERSMIVCETEDFVVDQEWLTRECVTTQPLGQPLSRELLTQEKELIETVLAETQGRVSRAAATRRRFGH